MNIRKSISKTTKETPPFSSCTQLVWKTVINFAQHYIPIHTPIYIYICIVNYILFDYIDIFIIFYYHAREVQMLRAAKAAAARSRSSDRRAARARARARLVFVSVSTDVDTRRRDGNLQEGLASAPSRRLCSLLYRINLTAGRDERSTASEAPHHLRSRGNGRRQCACAQRRIVIERAAQDRAVVTMHEIYSVRERY